MKDERSLIVATGYDRVANRYEQLEESEWPRLRRLRELLARIPVGGAVLDLGCGNGIPSLVEIAKRHQATGVDISAVQTARAQANVPTANVLQADIAEVGFGAESFDAVVSFYALEHVPREHHADILRRLRRWLRPGGALLFTVEARGTHETIGEWLGEPMFFSQFGPDETLALVRDAGFVVESADVEAQREGATEIEYLWIRARRDQ